MVPVSSHCRLFFGFIAVLLTTPAGIGLGLPQAAADNTIKNGWDKPPKVELQLTEEERAWLEKHKVIRIAGPKAFPPFHYYTKDGTLNGMAADYMRYIADLLGVRVEVQANLKWPEVLERAQRREIDVISCAARAPDREAYLAFTDPYLSFPLVIISRKDASFIGGLDDLNGKKVAFIQKVMTYEWVRRDGIDVVPHFADTPLKALEAVSFGQVDAHIANLASSSYLMQKHGMVNLRIAAPTSYGNYNLYIAVRKDWPELVTIFNKVLNTIPPQQHTEVKNRWLTVRYEHGIGMGDILKYVLLVAGIAMLILAVILVWNKRLQREIA
ncbi:MAG: transporter substrate-binding domain-containing protein, partial [Proteobacteria bacterium]|nr:transporter substrate-binding domain-containing protein [Pseudomonadota bacterium]